ncbi:hypothetical protein [Azospirillum soli]|uniref:hypothetical protein n=1 Tax=Azospirillum soli TaxID=1304799 RepID=UPI001AE556E3|nr:hypothetical protein [Azospirillum soli]MBP2316527.1 hypothetical protein [Azospirillum soli]
MYQSLSFRITGVSPLLMHNGRLADPLEPLVKEIKKLSGKRPKTETDQEQMAKLEFLGSLYLHGGEPCLPGELIEAALIDGAMRKRRGPQAKAGLLCDGNIPLQYEGPRRPEDLWNDDRFRFRTGVRIGRLRVMRVRPRFDTWSAAFTIQFMPSLLNEDEVRDIVRLTGEVVGIGDWRPKFGRFIVH